MKDERIEGMDPRELLEQYEQIRKIAARDSMTGLLNRRELEQQINLRLKRMQPEESCALFIIDLDNFKAINDTLGHQTGDQVLMRAADIISSSFRASDIVGRLGGDEFVVFLSGKISEELVRKKGQAICDHLQLVMGNGSELMVTASVGIHLASGNNHTFEFLYRSADLALYKAKKYGKQSYCIKQNTGDQEAQEDDLYTPVNAVRLKGLLDHIDSGVAMIDLKEPMMFLYVSPAFARMLGREAAEISRIPALEFIHPDEGRELEDTLRNRVMRENETVSQVIRVMDKDGNTMWWRMHAVRVEYNREKSVVLITVTDISELKEKETRLRSRNELFQIALNQTMQEIWEVRLDTGNFRLMGENKSFPAYLAEPSCFPEALIQCGWVSAETADGFREFAQELFSGRTQGYGNFRIRYGNTQRYYWASFSYRMVYNELGRPERAVGILEELSPSAENTAGHRENVGVPEGMMDTLVIHVETNLSQDEIGCLWLEGRDITGETEYRTCTELLDAEKEKMFHPDVLRRFPYYFTRKALLEAYQKQGKSWMAFEYQRIDGGGNIGWVFCVLRLTCNTKTGDIHMESWTSRLDLRRKWENAFGSPVQKDPVSMLYTHTSARELSMFLLSRQEYKYCALMSLEIDGIARLFAQDSYRSQKKWQAIVTALMLALGTSCVAGQCGKDCFLIFFPEALEEDGIRRRLEQAFLFVRAVTADLTEEDDFRFLAGVVRARREDQPEYDRMVKAARELCRLWSNTAGDRIAFSGEKLDESWDQVRKSRWADQVRIGPEEAERPLTEKEKDAALECAMGMLQADTLEESARCVLRVLGEYYKADRTYILVPVEQGHIVTMPHEWTSSYKNSIQHVVSGMLIGNFPMLQRCSKVQKPVFLTRKGSGMTDGRNRKNADEIWHYAVIPMQYENDVQAYLCIENAHEHMGDSALPMMLGTSLVRERTKYLKSTRQHRGEYGISSLDYPNMNAYMETIYSYNSEVYSTLGAVCVDVPLISMMNKSQGAAVQRSGTELLNQGYEYGRKMLWYISQVLKDIFGVDMAFRTWDAEFVALCPNTTQQVFLGKCARLRAILTRRYPNEIRVGFTWADKVFAGKALVDEARALMRCDSSAQAETAFREMLLPPELACYESVGEMIQAGRFTLFIQPKFNMENGEAIGGEALIRGVDKEGNIIPPIRFVEEMERTGAIRDLDLFILDKTMQLLDHWREEGYRLLPVSVNFSRITLFDTRALASLLAIQSRYPRLDPGLVEIEITESAGHVSQDTLKDVMESFREYGVQFGLDDFGSHFSNLAIFTNIKFETVKLDRSLVSEIARNEKSQMLVKEIVQICRHSGMKCIAEGVETMNQVMTLLKAGCTMAQGYYYDHPMPAEKFCKKYIQT